MDANERAGRPSIMECLPACAPIRSSLPPTSWSSGQRWSRWAATKMTKSYHNVTPISPRPMSNAGACAASVTDSQSSEAPKIPRATRCSPSMANWAGAEATEAMATRYRAGRGYREVKDAVAELIEVIFGVPVLATRSVADERTLNAILASGAARARSRAKTVMAAVRAARGLRS